MPFTATPIVPPTQVGAEASFGFAGSFTLSVYALIELGLRSYWKAGSEEATGKTPERLGSPSPLIRSLPRERVSECFTFRFTLPWTAIFAVRSHVFVSLSIHGPSRKAPPPPD